MINLNNEMAITDSERSELILYLFNDMKLLKKQNHLETMQSFEIYNHFVDNKSLPAWIRQRINKDFSFAAKLHELIIRYKKDFVKYSY